MLIYITNIISDYFDKFQHIIYCTNVFKSMAFLNLNAI